MGATGSLGGGRAAARGDLLADHAYEEIRQRILSMRLRPGAAISELELAQELGLGRTPVREALRRLASDYLVQIVARRGAFVADVDVSDLGRISEVRVQLEGFAARCAAERATTPERDHFQTLAARVRASRPAAEPEALVAVDEEVHRHVYRCTHNRFLEDSLVRHYSLIRRVWSLVLDRLPSVRAMLDDHLPILDALESGDGERAGDLMRRHVVGFERDIREVLINPATAP